MKTIWKILTFQKFKTTWLFSIIAWAIIAGFVLAILNYLSIIVI